MKHASVRENRIPRGHARRGRGENIFLNRCLQEYGQFLPVSLQKPVKFIFSSPSPPRSVASRETIFALSREVFYQLCSPYEEYETARSL